MDGCLNFVMSKNLCHEHLPNPFKKKKPLNPLRSVRKASFRQVVQKTENETENNLNFHLVREPETDMDLDHLDQFLPWLCCSK